MAEENTPEAADAAEVILVEAIQEAGIPVAVIHAAESRVLDSPGDSQVDSGAAAIRAARVAAENR